MFEDQWWSRLSPSTRAWLIDNNGDAVPDDVACEVANVGGPVAAEVASEDGPKPDLFYSDEIVDWVEQKSNYED
ncbi:UNVERIFIED_ORG: hypothetical protein ABIB52_004667 [Arthrobacter sp. UYCu721]